MSNKREKPKAFVVMPFDEEARSVYEEFIAPTLASLGFDVFRADDLLSQQNILADIVSSIASSDLIIADLTDSNPNVYYELGLAHALRKPVILLGQDMDEIPFDIRPYRLIVYSTHFARIAEARKALGECARGFLNRTVIFGNPVADFLGLEVEGQRPSVSTPANGGGKADTPDDRGLVDHAEALENTYGELGEILQELAGRTQRIGDLMEKAGVQIEEDSSQEGAPGRNRLRKVARSLANDLEEFRVFMADANHRYETAAGETENTLEFMLEFSGLSVKDNPSGTKERLDSELSALSEVLDVTRSGRQAFQSLYASMNEVPPIERHLTRAIVSAAQEVQKMADNVGQTEAAISRAIRVGERIQSGLREESKEAGHA